MIPPLPILIAGIVFAVALCVAGKCAFNGVCADLDRRDDRARGR